MATHIKGRISIDGFAQIIGEEPTLIIVICGELETDVIPIGCRNIRSYGELVHGCCC